MDYENPWQYQGKVFDDAVADDYVGFVYCIENLTNGRKYIGKKLFWGKKTKMVNKKPKKVKCPSDWHKYYGSSDELKEDISKGSPLDFRREILYLCGSKGELNYMELREQVLRDVLRDDQGYYNAFVGGKIHRKHLIKCSTAK